MAGSSLSRLRRRWKGAAEVGAALIEFAIVAPLFCLLFAGMIDVGGVLMTKFFLDNGVSAGANYALVNATQAESTDGETLANHIAQIVASSRSDNWANVTVVVNNGPSYAIANGSPSSGGTDTTTADQANSCYCPTGSPTNWSWGSAVPCGHSCSTNGPVAGKFVTITASRSSSPLFFRYGIVRNGAISTAAAAQVQ